MIAPLVLAAALLGSALPTCPSPLELGAKLKHPPHTDQVTMTHSAQLDPVFECIDNRAVYAVAWREGTKKVTFISTSDENFRSADGLKVNDTIEVIPAKARAYPGWRIFWNPDKDGWAPEIGNMCFADPSTEGAGDRWGMQYPCPVLQSDKPLRVRILGFAKHPAWKPNPAKSLNPLSVP